MTPHVYDVQPTDIFDTCADQVDRFVHPLPEDVRTRASAMAETVENDPEWQGRNPYVICATAIYASWRAEREHYPSQADIGSACGVSGGVISKLWRDLHQQYERQGGDSA